MIFQILRALLREIILHKTLIAIGFAIVSFAVLAAGFFWPKQYEVKGVLYADEQNIIKPLLQSQAAVTSVDRAQAARDLLQTRRMAEIIAKRSGLVGPDDSPAILERTARLLQATLGVEGFSPSGSAVTYVRISYTNPSKDTAFKVVSAAVDAFIRETSESKQRESRNAYQFISSQVKTYKQQLANAEDRLKVFNADNRDGNEQTVATSISMLQSEIQKLKLDIDDARIRKASTESQLSRESQYLTKRFSTDVYRDKLREAQSKLDSMLLTYTPTHPDVVNLKHQIEDFRQAMEESETSRRDDRSSAGNINPLYEQLRKTLSTVTLELESKQKRLTATQQLLDQEYDRSRRIAGRKAEQADLTRDYDVTKKMYESLLESKERARISMTLDVEGQGVTYRIQEAPLYPSVPKGLRFLHFALAGPFLGLLVPIGALVAYIQLDPRIRYQSVLEGLSVPVLAVVPHMNTPFAKRMLRSDMILLSLFMTGAMIVYAIICFGRWSGWFG
ncbi:Polysaccharide chain length determinant protein [gamma proteobacterium HdN1]|nr:Polysaccharide chain length determinant protein [gamma proteobacterium HdN1]